MSVRFFVALLALLALPVAGHATVWQRARLDGTMEFTNAPTAGPSWRAVRGGESHQVSSRPRERGLAPATNSVVWTRERTDGVVEFTNLPPVGSRWKVLFRIGPGKASAMRGDSDVVPPRDTSLARYQRFDDHIRDQQAYFAIPQSLIRAVMKTESDYDPLVLSSAGAQGLMQLMPGTARAMGVTNVWDPRQNIMGGSRYLQMLAKRFCRTPAVGRGDGGGAFMCSFDETIKVLAGYHAGPGAVEKYGGMPPYETTRAYVTSVMQRYQEYRRREAALAAWSGAAPVALR
ncbi:MAG TPA: lytic transglycosylase domain-containing protein [Polyangia bacterium]